MADQQPESNGGGFFDGIRYAVAEVFNRFSFAGLHNVTFGGKRDIYKVLGYKRYLEAKDYRERYERDGVAARIVEAFPEDTWRGGADLVEDSDPETLTQFEEDWAEIAKKHNIWSTFERADVLAGLGRYSILLLGAPGELDQPLGQFSLEQLMYVQPYSEEDAGISTYVTNVKDPRFGEPDYYQVQRSNNPQSTTTQRVHWSRVIHIPDMQLDDNTFGQPRLKRVWNRLDDLEKVIGGGAEAFWMRANQGTQFNLDKDFKWPAGEAGVAARERMKDDIEEYVHGIARTIRTKGMEINTLGSDVADFLQPAEAIFTWLATATKIPKRILQGSERGELASTTDKTTWDQRVSDRRKKFAAPLVIHKFVERLIEAGALPDAEYEIVWLESQDLDDKERAALGIQWASINKQMGETVVTAGEIRDRVLNLPPLEEVLSPEELAELDAEDEQQQSGGFDEEGNPVEEDAEDEELVAAARRERPSWEGIHRAADTGVTKTAAIVMKELRRAGSSILASELETAARVGTDHVDALVARALATVQPTLQAGLEAEFKRILVAGARAESKQLGGFTNLRASANVAVHIEFDVANPEAERWASTHAARLVTEVNAETRAAIRAVVSDALASGIPPRELARRLRPLIGLTERQAQAVMNRQLELLSANPGTLVRVGKVKVRVPKEGMSAARATRIAKEYADRLHRQRAVMIARTETLAASNEGQRILWKQAVERGELRDNLERVWIVTPDDRLCPVCNQADGQRRRIDEPFQIAGVGTVMNPPAHPQCRCAQGIVVPEARQRGAA